MNPLKAWAIVDSKTNNIAMEMCKTLKFKVPLLYETKRFASSNLGKGERIVPVIIQSRNA